MKMPSTYISLLLLGGFILIFYYTHQSTRHNTRPGQVTPVVQGSKPAIKKSLPADGNGIYLSKNQNKESMQEQARLNNIGTMLLKDAITCIAPMLKIDIDR